MEFLFVVMQYRITKKIFLESLQCRKKGWFSFRLLNDQEKLRKKDNIGIKIDIPEYRLSQGIQVHSLARFFPFSFMFLDSLFIFQDKI